VAPPSRAGANAAGTGGTLTLGDGTHWASLSLLGQYAAAGFAIGADATGGGLVTYTTPIRRS
jgi:trimeric autotransporter adhesin